MALWLFDETATRLPSASSAAITCEPVYVLPAPGGPWMNR